MARYYLGSFRTYLEAEYDGGAEGEGLAVREELKALEFLTELKS